MKKEIETLPIIALRGMTILPYMVIHFDVSRKKINKKRRICDEERTEDISCVTEITGYHKTGQG